MERCSFSQVRVTLRQVALDSDRCTGESDKHPNNFLRMQSTRSEVKSDRYESTNGLSSNKTQISKQLFVQEKPTRDRKLNLERV